MGKTGRWIKNLLTGNKKDKERVEKESKIETHHQNAANNGSDHHRPTTPVSIPQPTTPREKRRWSFRRSSATAPAGRMTDLASSDNIAGSTVTDQHAETDTKKHAMAVAVATAAAADAAVAAAKAAAAMMQLTAAAGDGGGEVEEAAAVKIQSVFRGYLARKALNALKGLVKLQALVRGHLVRKQATATLRCMQALVTVQARARAQRLRMVEEIKSVDQISHYNYNHRKSLQENRYRSPNKDFDRGLEENVKIVEMDLGDYKPVTKARNSYSNHTQEHRISTHRTSIKQENLNQISPSPSAVTDMSPRTYSNHFEDYSFGTAQSSPQCYSAMSKPDSARIPFSYPRSEYAESLYSEYSLYPNYMANTESSRAKVRSHSAPKQRPIETFERQLSRGRRPSLEGRNVPRAVKMQRSSSHVGSTAQNYQYPWSVKLDKSAVSLKDSECGSTSTVLTTNTIYCRSHVGTFDVQGARY